MLTNLDLQTTVGQIRTDLQSVINTLTSGQPLDACYLDASYALIGAITDYTVLLDAQDADNDFRINSLDDLALNLNCISTLDSDLRSQVYSPYQRGSSGFSGRRPQGLINQIRSSLVTCVQGAINSLDIIR